MAEPQRPGIVLDSFETIFARVCLERGWTTRAQIAQCLVDRGASTAGGAAALPAILVARRILSAEQAETLLAEVTEISRLGRYSEARKTDVAIGQLLVEAGSTTPEKVKDALAIQKERVSHGRPPQRLGEILLEKGSVTLAALQDALRHQERLVRFSCPTCGARYAAEESSAEKVLLCENCATPLAYSTSQTNLSAVVPEPEEVKRAATNPKNVLGKYVVVAELGRGGTSAVYKAWDTALRKWVALKVLLASGQPELLLRFRREAETAAELQHPNIIPIYDVGEASGSPYIAMKYVEGETLAGKTLSVQKACELVAQVARAVGHAHRRDIIHRDLKPSNLLIDASGRVYIMDFGLAKDLWGGAGLTAPGQVMGTPSYMPPEQAAGEVSRVNQRSDVYSLGAILYDLLTGRPPFKGSWPVETIRLVLREPVTPPSRHRPEIAPDLERIVLRALEKDKSRRYPTADALAEALERYLGGEPPASEATVAEGPTSPSRAKRKALGWILMVLAAGALAALWAYARR